MNASIILCLICFAGLIAVCIGAIRLIAIERMAMDQIIEYNKTAMKKEKEE